MNLDSIWLDAWRLTNAMLGVICIVAVASVMLRRMPRNLIEQRHYGFGLIALLIGLTVGSLGRGLTHVAATWVTTTLVLVGLTHVSIGLVHLLYGSARFANRNRGVAPKMGTRREGQDQARVRDLRAAREARQAEADRRIEATLRERRQVSLHGAHG